MKIYRKITNVYQTIFESRNELLNNTLKNDDLYGLSLIQSLLLNKPYLPLNGGALRPIGVAYLLNEILINQRKNILEFGSGLTTLLMARLINENNLDCKVISVEHNEHWAKTLKVFLKNENLEGYVSIVVANLKPVDTPLGKIEWYDNVNVKKNIESEKFDLVFVDGPPANTVDKQFNRYLGLFEIKDYLSQDSCLILDDANRVGEKKIIELFKGENVLRHYELVFQTIGVFRTHVKFNPLPFKY